MTCEGQRLGVTHVSTESATRGPCSAPLTPSSARIRRAPTLASYFLQLCDDPLDASSCERRLSNGLLPSELRSAALVDRLPELERKLLERVAFMDTAIDTAAQPLSAGDLVATVLAESVVTTATHTGPAAVPADQPATDAAGSVLRDRELNEALIDANFRQCALALASIDDSTADGRRAALAAAFNAKSVIITRLLLHGSSKLARSHELLARLHSLRPYLYDYLSYCQTLQPDGSRSARAAKWSWTGEANECDTQLKLFLRQDYVGMNWIDGPYGAHGLKMILTGAHIAPIDPVDHYVVIAALEELSAFGASTFAAIGFPAHVPAADGFSWRTFLNFYIAHLKHATSLSTNDEVRTWLSKSDTYFRSALREMGRAVRRVLESPRPKDEVLHALLPPDAPATSSLLSCY